MKLGNVKILDVKEGEIKKIEYKGAEYERIDDYAIKDDLIFIQHETDKGFYKVENNKHTAWVCFTDSFNRKLCCLHTDCTVFRKKHTRLKVGDYARVVGDTYCSDIVGGTIVKITDLADEDGDVRFELVGDGDYAYAKPSSLEKVSAEDADKFKEEASTKEKWAKIGRKVGEYRKGDIVAYDDAEWYMNGGIGEITAEADEDNYILVSSVDYQGKRIRFVSAPGKLTLISPCEARFDKN